MPVLYLRNEAPTSEQAHLLNTMRETEFRSVYADRRLPHKGCWTAVIRMPATPHIIGHRHALSTEEERFPPCGSWERQASGDDINEHEAPGRRSRPPIQPPDRLGSRVEARAWWSDPLRGRDIGLTSDDVSIGPAARDDVSIGSAAVDVKQGSGNESTTFCALPGLVDNASGGVLVVGWPWPGPISVPLADSAPVAARLSQVAGPNRSILERQGPGRDRGPKTHTGRNQRRFHEGTACRCNPRFPASTWTGRRLKAV